MTELERNRIRAKLRRLALPDAEIERYLRNWLANLETYDSVCRTVDQWERRDPEDFILQVLVCGVAAALLGGWLALMGGV